MYTERAINSAAQNGKIDVLNWFDKSNHDFIYTIDAINYAANVSILDWFDKSKYDFLYTERAINSAARNGKIDVLDWFDKSDHDFIYTVDAINYAENDSVLDWFDKSGYEFKYTSQVINIAYRYNRGSIIRWFAVSKYELDYNDAYHQKVIKWCRKVTNIIEQPLKNKSIADTYEYSLKNKHIIKTLCIVCIHVLLFCFLVKKFDK